MNVNDALNQGWTNYTECNPALGIGYTQVTNGYPSKDYPITLFYSAEGQISGLGMTHFGAPLSSLTNYWQPLNDGTNNAFMSASFRAESLGLCDPNAYQNLPLGDQVVINQGTLNLEIPLTDSDATSAEYTSGACISEMGTHWSYDLQTAPVMSWIAANLQPVVPMYENGSLVAFFFTTSNTQMPWPIGQWEVTIPSVLMCENWCDSSCDWDVSFWSTLHFFLDDYTQNICSGNCNLFHCCPN